MEQMDGFSPLSGTTDKQNDNAYPGTLDLPPDMVISSQNAIIISVVTLVLVAVILGVLVFRCRPCRLGSHVVPKREQYRPLKDSTETYTGIKPYHDYEAFHDN